MDQDPKEAKKKLNAELAKKLHSKEWIVQKIKPKDMANKKNNFIYDVFFMVYNQQGNREPHWWVTLFIWIIIYQFRSFVNPSLIIKII